jgi:predicted permease
MFTPTDFRYAARVLIKNPGFSIVAIVTLALGIGLNVTVFSILNVLLLKPSPVQHAADLVWITGASPDGNRFRVFSYPDLIDFRQAASAVRDVTALADARMAIRGGSESVRVTGQIVTGNYFDVLGVRAAAGRTLVGADDEPVGDRAVAVIGDETARRLFGTPADAVGKPIEVNGQPFTVVGVTPPRFGGADPLRPAGVWVPISMARQVAPVGRPYDRGSWWLVGIARLANDVEPTQAQAVLSGVAAAIAQAHPDSHKDVGVAIHDFRGTNPEDRGKLGALALLPAVPLAVLLIACANVASLLMARGAERQREMAVRTALGARRGQLVRQLFAESILLALAGGAGSLLISLWSPELLVRFAEVDAPLLADFTPDMRVVLFTVALSAFTALAFGLLPAFRAARMQPASSLRGEFGVTSGPGATRLQRLLVAGQLAMSLVLLVATIVFINSVAQAGRTHPGFETAGRVTLSLDLKMQRYTDARALAFEQDALARVASLPGMQRAALAQYIPLGGWVELTPYYTAGRAIDPEARPPSTSVNKVGPGFFETLQLPLRRGRAIAEGDQQTKPRVAVVNETLAARLAPDGNAVGERVILGTPTAPPLEIVGVVADAIIDEFGEPPRPAVYLPRDGRAGEFSIVAWTALEPGAALQAIERAVRSLDGSLAVFDPMTMTQHLAERMDGERGLSRLLGVAGGLALALAAFGLYGVTAYTVTRRTREIGVRVALGASRRGILQMILRDALKLAAWGIISGLIPGFLLTYALSGMIFGVGPTDLRAVAASTALLIVAAVTASYVPALRALRVDPIIALSRQGRHRRLQNAD